MKNAKTLIWLFLILILSGCANNSKLPQEQLQQWAGTTQNSAYQTYLKLNQADQSTDNGTSSDGSAVEDSGQKPQENLTFIDKIVSLFKYCAEKRDEFLSANLIEWAGISNSDTYKNYQNLKASGKIEADGSYADTTKCSVSSPIHVTFADNDLISVSYFQDAEGTQPIDPENCCLKPGDRIFASKPEISNDTNTKYTFSKFLIYALDEKGKYKVFSESQPDGKNLVLQIPSDYKGKELSVEPIGKYQDRHFYFSTFYTDDAGDTNKLYRTWLIDGNEVRIENDDKGVEVSSTKSLDVSYKFDQNRYYFVSSVPVCTKKPGELIFPHIKASDKDQSFQVELHPYLSISIPSSVKRKVTIGNGSKIIKGPQVWEFSKLKLKDQLTITTDSPWPELSEEKHFSGAADVKQVKSDYIYQLTVTADNSKFCFDPSDFQYGHGKISFTCLGKAVTSPICVPNSNGLQIDIASAVPDEGYWFPDDFHSITIKDSESTQNEIEKLRFYPHQKATVNLPQPPFGGSVTYSIRGETISSAIVSEYMGTRIDETFTPWAGWTAKSENPEYRISEQPIQNVDVQNIFDENEWHKPKLSVKLDNSIDDSFTFDISAINNHQTISKSKGKQSAFSGKIGTANDITITASGKMIAENQSLQFTIDKINDSGEKRTEVRYLHEFPAEETIQIYTPEEQFTETTFYKTISVTIRLVNVLTYADSSIPNGSLQLRFSDTGEVLQEGCILDGSREITLTITPNQGYSISGEDVENGFYQKEMPYKNYLTNIEKIITNHPINRIMKVTLNTKDDYGTCTYHLNGKEVSGETELRIGQNLTLDYELKDTENYQFCCEKRNIFYKILSGCKSEKNSVDILITEDIDGKVITGKDYICITEKGK